mgnify:CR=1 FL=1
MATEKSKKEKSTEFVKTKPTTKKEHVFFKKCLTMMRMRQDNRMLKLVLAKNTLLASIAEQRTKCSIMDYQKADLDVKMNNITKK